MGHASANTTKQLCQDMLPTTGQRCSRPASITIYRFGEPFSVCAECAMRNYLRHQGNGAAEMK
jgi:hypothetical protein